MSPHAIKTLRTIALLSALSVGTARDVHAQVSASSNAAVTIPDTRPGRMLRGWLDVFNRGDSARLDAFLRKYMPQEALADHLSFHDQSGGVDLVRVLKSEPLSITVLLQQRKDDMHQLGTLTVGSGTADTATSFTMVTMPKGTTEADLVIDAATRHRVVDSIVAELNAHYVYPEVARQMGEAIRSHESRGDYDRITNGVEFADSLVADLRAVSHDKHLFVAFNPARLPVQTGNQPSPEDLARYRKNMEALNCGFDRVERLPSNVGYLKFDFFASPAT